jgi:membrane associated rhomboid family serine protease
MQLLERLERTLRPFVLPNLTLGLISCQLLIYILAIVRPDGGVSVFERIELIPERVLDGEVWRVLTFLIVPPFGHPIFNLLFWYFFYLMGTTLENQWGTVRYNLFIFTGAAATVVVSFLTPDVPASNGFLEGSVFLAFAFLYPEFEIYLFLILPVKIKWLAALAWIHFGLTILFGDLNSRLIALAAVCNFFLFFGRDLYLKARYGHRRMAAQAKWLLEKDRPFHRCLVCGITDKTHPHMEFRYCSKCAGACGYCSEHLHQHEHITADIAS